MHQLMIYDELGTGDGSMAILITSWITTLGNRDSPIMKY